MYYTYDKSTTNKTSSSLAACWHICEFAVGHAPKDCARSSCNTVVATIATFGRAMATAEGGRASQGLTVLCRCDVDVDRLKSVSWANIYYIIIYLSFLSALKLFGEIPMRSHLKVI